MYQSGCPTIAVANYFGVCFFLEAHETKTLMSLDLESLSMRRSFHHCIAIYSVLSEKLILTLILSKVKWFIHINKMLQHYLWLLLHYLWLLQHYLWLLLHYLWLLQHYLWLLLPRTNWGKQIFIYLSTKEWNSLPPDMKETCLLIYF